MFQYVTDAVAPSIIFWTTNGSGAWSNAGNWSAGIPGLGDYAVIDQDNTGVVVTISSPISIAGMQAENNITIDSTGSLTMSDDLLFTGDNLVLNSTGIGLTMDGIATIAGQMD